MTVPATTDEFLACVTSSGIVETARLDPYTQALRRKGNLPPAPKPLATRMIADGLITPFQGQQLLLGRHRNFILGRYKILEPLGAGGMGRVFLCEHLVMRHRVAVKMLPRKKKEDPARVARFFREARAVAALSHPNIVRAHDIDTSNEQYHYIVMDYVDGVSLHDLVQKRGPLDPAHAANYVAQIARGLQHISEAGLIHRDLKPANLLLDRDGLVKILDLGLARFSDDEDRITEKYNDTTLLGTADFISPEQSQMGGDIDIRSDIYCLGASFYYLLTARVPFESESIMQKILGHQLRDPQPIRELRPQVPPEMDAVVRKMMAKKPKARYQTPAELLDALSPWANLELPPPHDDELPKLSRASQGSLGSRSDINLRPGRSPMPSPRRVTAPVTMPVPTIAPPKSDKVRTVMMLAAVAALAAAAVFGMIHR